MEQVNGGKVSAETVCEISMAVVGGIWSTGFGMIAPWAGFAASLVFGGIAIGMCGLL